MRGWLSPKKLVQGCRAALERVPPGTWLAGAGLSVATFWLAHGPLARVAFAAGVVASVGLVSGRRLAGGVAAGLLVAYGAMERWGPGLPIAYDSRLALEAVGAVLPFAWVLASRMAVPQWRGSGLALGAAGIALAGTAARILEAMLLMSAPGTEATIRYSLRLDVAYVFWAVAALALAASGVLARPQGVRARRAAAAVGIMLLLVVPVVDLATAVAVSMKEPSDLRVGVHAVDVDTYPETVFDFMHLDVSWGRVERQEGELNWSRYDAKIRAAEARGIPVYLLVSTYPPKWLVEKYPEAVMVDQGGDPFYWIDEAPGSKARRVWEMSFHHEPTVSARLDFLRAALDRYADSPSVEIVAVLNEPHYPSDWNLLRWASYDPYTVGAFRETLKEEWDGNLTALNERYGTEFVAWAEVRPPTGPVSDLAGRWREFREDALVEHVHRFVAEARLLTDKPVTVKIAAHYISRFANPQAGLTDRTLRAMATMSDVVSVDLYPVSTGDLVRSLEYYRTLADGKPVIVSEFNLAFGSRAPLAGAQLLAALSAMDEHADGVVLFTLDDHYLYELRRDSPVFAALALFRANPGTLEFPTTLAVLMGADLANVSRGLMDAVEFMARALTVGAARLVD